MKIRILLKRALHPLLWALAILPLFLMISAGIDLLAPWVYEVLFLLFGSWIVCMKKRRLLVAALGILVLVGLGFLLFQELRLFVMPAVCTVLLLLLCSADSISGFDRSAAGIAGLLFYLAAQYCISRADQGLPGFLAFGAIRVPVLLGFLVLALLLLLQANLETVEDAAGKHVLPTSVLRRNRILVFLLAGLVLFLAALPLLQRALFALWEAIKQGFFWLVALIMSLLPDTFSEQGGGGGGGGMDLSGLGESSGPSPLAVFLEKVIMVVAAIGLAVLLFFAVRAVIRKLKVLWAHLRKMLDAYLKSTGEDYVDEITDTRDSPEAYERRQRKKRKRRVFSDSMTNQEKVRYGYGHALDLHPDWKTSATARETLGVETAAVYEKVRYANQDVSQEETETFLNRTK